MLVKFMKRATIAVASVATVLALTGCGLFGADATESVEKLVDAYTSKDVKELKKCFDETDRMQYLIKALDGTGVGRMQVVYEKIYELTSAAEITVLGEGSADDRVKIKIKTVDYSDAIYEEMTNAMKKGGNAFMDAPYWMLTALSEEGESLERELEVHVQPNGKIYGVEYNEEFLNVLTGGFYDYIGCTMAKCSQGNNASCMLANSDRVIYSLDEHQESVSGMTVGNVNGVITHFKSKYEGLAGVEAGGTCGETSAKLYLIVNYKLATNSSLQQIGAVAGNVAGYVSLNDSVKGMQANGYNCEVTDFGVGVKNDTDK